MRLGFSLAIKRGMAPELSMMRLAFLKNSLINKKRVRRGGAKYNSGLINKKWVRSGRALSAIQSGHTGTPDLKKKKKKKTYKQGGNGTTHTMLFIYFFFYECTQCYSHSHVLAFTNCTQGGSGTTHTVF